MSHVFSRLAGHGLIVFPAGEFRIESPAEPAATTLDIATSSGRTVIDVAAVARGDVSTDVVEVVPGRVQGPWRIETSVFTCAWPAGFAVSNDPDGLSAFLLLGPNESMLWVAGPLASDKATPIEKLVAEDQAVREIADQAGNARIDLDYIADAEAWWQRKYVLVWGDDQVLVIAAQARLLDEAVTRAAIDAVAASMAVYQPD